jgi:hypothetical protein
MNAGPAPDDKQTGLPNAAPLGIGARPMSGTVGFLVAVAIAAAICFVLMGRTDRLSQRRRAHADGTPADSGGSWSGDGTWLGNWFNGHASSGDSCAPSVSSASDSSCSDGASAGDGGGGDGGGGGGGGD